MGAWSHEKSWNLEEIYKPACREPMIGVLTTSGNAQRSGPASSGPNTWGIQRCWFNPCDQLRWGQGAGEAKADPSVYAAPHLRCTWGYKEHGCWEAQSTDRQEEQKRRPAEMNSLLYSLGKHTHSTAAESMLQAVVRTEASLSHSQQRDT